ncbi:MAG: SusC/RagA family TonB-linked outer membrane protein [Prevotellaceae bacterium]|nr:SusC/RagA family TonB-linked outer membrane protein [Prevotellaceae bacterium]
MDKKSRWIHFLMVMLLMMAAFAAEAKAQRKAITMSFQNEKLSDVFRKIENVSDYKVIFSVSDVSKFTVTGSVKNASIEATMNKILSGVPLKYSVDGLYVNVTLDKGLPTVRGSVVDENGEAVIGATVMVKGTNIATTTNIEGKFLLEDVSLNNTIRVSYIGMESVELKASKNMVVTLRNSENSLNDVVVTGYYTQRKQTFTGAATSYSGKELRAISNQNVLSTISAIDPSFKLVDNISMGSDPNTIPNVQVRGMNSLPATDVTNLNSEYKGNSNLPTFILDGFEVSVEKIYDLDPNRISNISILKDASATAIYGSRASNGVVIIDTKAPESGKLRLNYTGSLDFEVADLSGYDLLNAAEKLEYERLAGLYNGSSAVYVQEDYLADYNERLKMVKMGIDTDWLSKPLKSVGLTNKHSVLIEGGNDSFRYGVDLNYSGTSGVMKGSGRDRIGTGLKFQYTYKNLRFKDYVTYDKVSSENSPYGSFSTYAKLNPYFTPYDSNGNIRETLYTNSNKSGSTLVTNPMYNSTLNTIDKTVYDNFTNNFSVEWDIMQGLKLKGNFSIERQNKQTDIFKPSDHTDFIGLTENKGSYMKGYTSTNSYDGNIILSYFQTFGKHSLSVNGGWNIQETSNDYSAYTVYGFPNQSLDHPSLGAGFKEGDHAVGYATKTRLMGFLANANYSYADRYFVDGSVRADGSSVFGSNNRWGVFWSAGLGWNIHNELFLKDNRIVNQLRLRASTGYTGSQNFYPYQSMLMYNYSSDLAYQDYIGAVIKAYGNNDLKWQRTRKTNIGVDFEFFDRRITGYFNYFIENSEDLLVDVNMANYLGFTSYKENLGETENKGYEFNVKACVFKDRNSNVSLFVNGMHYSNKLKKISSGLSSYNKMADASGSTAPYVRYEEGASINSIWVVPSMGIDPGTGNEIFIKKDGTLTNTWSEEDYVPYKTTDPKLAGTFGLNAYHRGWELNVNFYYRFGGYAYNQTLVDKVENVDPYGNVDKRALYDRWSTPGVISKYKRISDLSKTMPTSRFVEKDNVLSGNSLSLAYTFRTDWIRSFGAQYLKLTATANDFLYTSTIHREMGTTYPYAHHYTLQVQLTF